MMRIALVALTVFSSAVIAQEAAVEAENTCPTGLYGTDCAQVCTGCLAGAACKTSGACEGECAEGWKKLADGKCDPICFGQQGRNGGGCENDGECVAPDYCICGKSGAQVVGVAKEGGVQCVSLRKDGIKGAFISMAVMFISIGFCGAVERQRNKGKK